MSIIGFTSEKVLLDRLLLESLCLELIQPNSHVVLGPPISGLTSMLFWHNEKFILAELQLKAAK